MESPVVVDKPPEYHGTERGFPFDEEDGSGAWSELAARHPDIAARLRQRPATWARKRRPSSQDATDDFGESFSGFDRFPFDDIPPEFREHFPTHWNRRFSTREEQPQTQAAPQSPSTQQQTAATQTEQDPGPSEPAEQAHLPQYGLRNTVDLGQKSPADPSVVDAEERNQRSMSAPPDSSQNQSFKMSGQNHEQPEQPSNVRHIPIFVEGRDEPVINRSADAHFAEKQYAPPPQVDRDQYFADEPVGFHHPPNFSRAFGTPFNKGYRQGPQPFQQQKAYPHAAFARGASPQRSQSPKPAQPQPQPQAHPHPQPHPHHEEQYVKVPVQHEQSAPRPPPQQRQPPPPQPQPQQHQPQKQPSPQKEDTPPPQPKPTSNDPITQILSIQTDVLNLMTEVENFAGTKKDKRYLFLDEMLTRNLIKLDNIETDGKENIRQARKEAIKCIQKCIAVLEAKADSNMQAATKDIDMKENVGGAQQADTAKENGEVEMKEIAKEEPKVEPTTQAEQPPAATPTPQPQEAVPSKPEGDSQPQEQTEASPAETKEVTQTEAADTRPENIVSEQPSETTEEQKEKVDKSKKGTKVVKQRNKSKDNKDKAKDSDSKQEIEADSNKAETAEVDKKENVDVMQVDEKGDKTEPVMEVDGAASQ